MFRHVAFVVFFLVLVGAGCASPRTAVAADVSVGDSVLAYWQEADAYFIATVVERQGKGYLVVFEDGDLAAVAGSKIRKNNLKAGSKVIARWTDGKYYGGTVAKTVGRAFYIHYADGSKRWVPWSWIAVK